MQRTDHQATGDVSISTANIDRPKSRDLKLLRRLFGFLQPYRQRVALAVAALITATAAVLAFG